VPFLSQVAIRRVGVNRWQLLEPLCFRDPVTGRTYTAPAGFITDFATVPRITQWAVPRTGMWDEPAVIHDLGCEAVREAWEQERENRRREDWLQAPLPVRQPWADARGVDQLWRRMLRDGGLDPVSALVLWAAVRWGALGSRYRWAGWWRDLPVLLPITALLLSLVLALVLLVAVASQGVALALLLA